MDGLSDSFLYFLIAWVNPWGCFFYFFSFLKNFISKAFLGPKHPKVGLKLSGHKLEGNDSSIYFFCVFLYILNKSFEDLNFNK